MRLIAISLVLLLFCSCKQIVTPPQQPVTEEIDGASFSYYKARGLLIAPTVIDDSIPASLVFDTGMVGSLILKSSFAKKLSHKGIEINKPNAFKSGHNKGFYEAKYVADSLCVTVGSERISFPHYYIVEDDSRLGKILEKADGMLPIPDSVKHIALLFSKQIISFNSDRPHPSDADIVLKMYQHKYGPYVVKGFPFVFSDSTVVYEDYMIDTGYRADIRYNGTYFSDAMSDALKNYTVHKFVFNSSGRRTPTELYCFKEAGLLGRKVWIDYDVPDPQDAFQSSNKLVGTEFLKGFDIYMDFEKDSIWFKKIGYIPLLEEKDDPYGAIVAGRFDKQGNYNIMYLKTESLYAKAGIKVGDVIAGINGRPYLYYADSLHYGYLTGLAGFKIIREGKDTAIVTNIAPYCIVQCK